MKNSKRNIAFFTLEVNECIEKNINEFIKSLMDKIQSLEKRERKHNLYNDRFCFMQTCVSDEDVIKCLFISAKHGTRLPLIDKDNLESRDNPKTKNEGEEEHTHVLLKFMNEECTVLLEQGRDLLKMKNICDYFNAFYNKLDGTVNNPLSYSLIASEDFESALNEKVSRLSQGEIFVDKRLLGSDSLNFSNRIETVKNEIILQIKPQPKENIKDLFIDIFKKFSTDQSMIKRIRIKGKSEDGTDCVADTLVSFIKKQSITIQKDEETGAVKSDYIFSQMKEISHKL